MNALTTSISQIPWHYQRFQMQEMDSEKSVSKPFGLMGYIICDIPTDGSDTENN